MDTNTEYVDIAELPANGEAFDASLLETSDYSDYEVTAPGRYVSNSRTVSAKQKPDGNITFEITFNGIVDEKGRKFLRPDRTWISTKKFTRYNRPGQTSGVAQYLRACGFDPKQVADLKESMTLSTTMPVGVLVGWEDKSVKDASGQWKNAGLKTRDFLNAEGKYVPQVEINGSVYTARPRVQTFFKIK